VLNLTDLLNKVVTVKTDTGLEYIGKFIGMNDDKTVFTLQNLKTVFLNENGQVMIMPFAFTSDEEIININASTVFAILPATEVAAKDYLDDLEDATTV
jgi:hypothetical protein